MFLYLKIICATFVSPQDCWRSFFPSRNSKAHLRSGEAKHVTPAPQLANTPVSCSKQAVRATPKDSLRMLCAILSTKIRHFVDKQ